MKERLLPIACIAVLVVILTLGLWPFHAPRNEVAWLQDRNGLRFGRFGTVFSSDEFVPPAGANPSFGTLEVWLQPGRIWDYNTFLAFFTPDDPFRFSLHQWQTGLLLRTAQDLHVDNVFRKTGPSFLTITAGHQGTIVYVDGTVAKRAPQFQLPEKAFTGRLVLGNSPGQTDSWRGQLLGLAIYRRELAANEVLEHFLTWTRQKRPSLAADEGNVTLYLFDERTGRVVHSQAGSDVALYIPEKYLVLDQMFLETPWSEFRRSQDFWGAVVKNIEGFIPLGFCFFAYFSLVRHYRRAALITVILGFAVSLTIELLQAFLPTRDSGMMDLITNTLGTWMGILLYHAARALWERHRRIYVTDGSPD